MGDREYVFACKGQPFCVLTAPQFPTPAFTMIDHNLVRELGIRMTDMQCVKIRYGGQNLIIFGKISTSVQCIIDGAPVGNMYVKAHVVTDVYQLFNTYAIAGSKLTGKLIGEPKDEEGKADETSDEPTEPTDSPKQKKRKKTKATKRKSPVASSPAGSSHSTMAIMPDTTADNTMASLHHALTTGAFKINTEKAAHIHKVVDNSPLPPSPLIQGRWIMKFRCADGCDPTDFEPYWVDRMTGKEQHMEPDSWRSNGSMYSYYSGDEYDDVYTNVSTIMKGTTDDDDPKDLPVAEQSQDDDATMMVHSRGQISSIWTVSHEEDVLG